MIQSVDAPEFDLRRHLRALRRRKGLIALLVLLGIASSLIVSWRQDPVYEGEAKVLLQRRTTEALFASESEEEPEPARVVKNEMEVIKSEPVEAAVREQLGPGTKVAVSQVGDTDVVKVKGRSTDRVRAAAIAKAYATAYIEFRRAEVLEDLNAATTNVQGKINALQGQVDSLDKQISEVVDRQIAAALAQARAVNPQAVDPSQYLRSEPVAGLSARREQLLSQQAVLKQQLDQLQLDAELRTGGAQLVTTTAIPTFEVTPHPVRTAIVALVLSLLVGIGLAFLLEYLDDRIRTKEDLDGLMPEVPVLGLTPVLPKWKDRSLPYLVTVAEPSSPAAESFRSLRTALQFVGVERPPRVFQVTSARSGEGKTTVVSNLAVVLARAGQRVVIVDADLRRPRLHEFFGLSNSVGLTSLFVPATTLETALQSVPGVENLALLPSGPLPPDPSELLSAKQTARVLADLQADFDVVLVDCPPVLPVADAIALSAWVDATILVVAAGMTARKEVRRTLELLNHAEAHLVGSVLTRVTVDADYGYQYEYAPQRAQRSLRGRARDHVAQDTVLSTPPAGNGDTPAGSNKPTVERVGPRDDAVHAPDDSKPTFSG